MFPKTSEQKWEFLGASYKYGTKVSDLKTALPHWSNDNLKHALNRYRICARKHLKASREKCSKDEFINIWSELLENCQKIEGTCYKPSYKRKYTSTINTRAARKTETNDHSFLISKAMKYAAHFEDHYQGPSSSDPNYSEIYSYISDLLSGEEPRQLRPGSATKVLQMMDAIKYIISNKDSTSQYTEYLSEHISFNLSYLNSGVNPAKVAKIKKEEANRAFETADSSESCPLFSEADMLMVTNLDKSDPNYIIARDEHIEKKIIGKPLLSIPGLNPFEVSIDSVVKPPVALLLAMESNYK